MSKYKQISTEFRNLETLKSALSEMGVPYEVAAAPKTPSLSLIGYHGDIRPEKASLVIRREWLNKHWSNNGGNYLGASNDIGFAWDGKQFTAIVSEYDSGREGVIAGLKALRQKYAVKELTRKARETGRTVTETTLSDGTVRLELRRF